MKLDVEFYKHLVDQSRDLITVMDFQGDIRFSSFSVTKVLGYSTVEMVGLNVFDLIHPADHEKSHKGFRETQNGEARDRLACRIRHKEGYWVDCEVVGNVVEHRDEELVAVHLRDNTITVNAINALTESRNAFMAAFQATSNIATITDPASGSYIEVNDAFLEATRWSREEVIGRTSFELGVWGTAENRDLILSAFDQQGGKLRRHRATIYDRDGAPIHLMLDACYLDVSGGVQLFLSAEDITETDQLEQQLRQSQKMDAIGQLTGGIAHDFNNMLSVIIGNAELAMMDGNPGELASESLGAIIKAANSGADLIQQLLLFSRQLELNPQRLELRQHLRNLTPFIRSTLEKDITLQVETDEQYSTVLIDPGQLDVALVNLAINAKNAMPDGGTLKLQLRSMVQQEKRFVQICVSDTGIGMDAETTSRALEPFFTTRQDSGGTGLGLSMVYGFVSQSDGNITFSSTPGEGTTVNLAFPFVADNVNSESGNQTDVSDLSSLGLVLVVDDNSEFCRLICQLFESMGVEATPVYSAVDALSAIETMPDLIVTDVMLPGELKGPQLISEIRKRLGDLPVVYVSGYQQNILMDEELRRGDVEFLQKPFGRDDLRRALEQIVIPK